MQEFARDIHIGSKTIGAGHPCFIIAEAGINHNGDMDLAKKLIDMSADAGADAVKFQTFIAEEEVTKQLKKVEYQKSGKDDTESYYDMIKKWEFDEGQHRELMAYSEARGIIFMSTPSEEVSARMLHRLDVPAYKIGSNDLVTIPMIEEIASWHKPMILSTGMAEIDEIQESLDVVSAVGNREIVLLHCTSSYPTPPQDLNLRAIETLRKTFGCLVGFSDHSAGTVAAVLAVLLGAVLVETHITLDKKLPGPDQSMALDPVEFATLVQAIRAAQKVEESGREDAIQTIPNAEVMLGTGEKRPTPAEMKMRHATRKGIVARRDIKEGEVITREMLAYKRPYDGLPARRYKDVIGKVATGPIHQDEYISIEKLS